MLEHDGSKLYKFLHMAKTRLEWLGILPLTPEAWRPAEEESKADLDGDNNTVNRCETIQDEQILDNYGWLLNSATNYV
jgi:hypothetical protein